MTRRLRLPVRALAAAGVFLLLAVCATAALSGTLQADAAYFDAGDQAGPVAMAWIQNTGEGAVNVHVEAASIHGTQYERRTPVIHLTPAVGPLPPLDAPLRSSAPEVTPVSATNVTLRLDDQGNPLTFSIRELSRGSLQTQAGLGSFEVHPLEGAFLSEVGVSRDAPPPTGTGRPPDAFSHAEVAEAVLLSRGSHLAVRVVLEGDFVLEAVEADFLLRHAGGEQLLVSKAREERVHPGAPEESKAAVYEAVDGFLRLEFRDARLELEAPYLEGAVEFAMRGAHVEPNGMVNFLNATGSLRGHGATVLQGERFTMVDGTAMDIAPGGEQLDVRLAPEAAQGDGLFARGVFVAPTESLGAGALWALGAVLLGSVLFFAARALARGARPPLLEEVETDIEVGRYHRAARRAGRILRRRPTYEAAAVARAVALSRGGRHATVIQEVEDRLASEGSSDGVLHYLLGLSYRKMDRPAEAFHAFHEAVQRTPALEAEVADQLGGPIAQRERSSPGSGYT